MLSDWMLNRPLRRRSCGERGCASYHTGRRIFIVTLRPVHLKIVSGRSLDRLGVSVSIQREAMSWAGCRFGNLGRWRAAETAPALGCVYAAALAASRIRKASITASEIGRAHVCTSVTHAHLVCRLMLEKKKQTTHKHN